MEVRIDKWLWAVRLYKTRSLASEACRLGKVVCNGTKVKPSHEVKENDVYQVNIDQLHRKVRVVQLLSNRVGAKDVAKYMEDLTPQEEYERIRLARQSAFEATKHGGLGDFAFGKSGENVGLCQERSGRNGREDI